MQRVGSLWPRVFAWTSPTLHTHECKEFLNTQEILGVYEIVNTLNMVLDHTLTSLCCTVDLHVLTFFLVAVNLQPTVPLVEP